jgi:ribosomal protein L4
MNSPEGKAQSRAYNEKLREKTIKWGMINALEHPTEGFQLVIINHFRFKKKRILEEISIWIDESSEARKSVLTTLHAELSILLTKL